MKPAIFSIAAYAAKTMTTPVGTRFELHGQKVGRITYTVRTCKLLMNAVYPGRRTLRRRWRMSRLYDRYEAACRSFFGYHPIGTKLLGIVDKLHEKYPESEIIFSLWLFCLPF